MQHKISLIPDSPVTARLASRISTIYYAYLVHLEYTRLPSRPAQIVPEPKENVVVAVTEKANANQTKTPGYHISYHALSSKTKIKRLKSKPSRKKVDKGKKTRKQIVYYIPCSLRGENAIPSRRQASRWVGHQASKLCIVSY